MGTRFALERLRVRLFDPLLFNGCLASEARQAVGIGRGAVGKPRTPQGPSTGLSCGRVACPRRARSIAITYRARKRAGVMKGDDNSL